MDAAGIAGLLTTTEAMIVDAPKSGKEGVPNMAGGMGGMGGMDDY
jgi:chaperonin GroEL